MSVLFSILSNLGTGQKSKDLVFSTSVKINVRLKIRLKRSMKVWSIKLPVSESAKGTFPQFSHIVSQSSA